MGGSTSGGSNAGGTEPGGGSGNSGGSGNGGTTSGGENLITNGDFSDSDEYWELTWNEGATAGTDIDGGEFCVYNLDDVVYLSFSLGYPPTISDAFTLEGGAAYTLQYDVRGFGTVEAKVGLAVDPWTEISATTHTVASSTYATRAYAVSTATLLENVGLVFNCEVEAFNDYVCFDNVRLTRD